MPDSLATSYPQYPSRIVIILTSSPFVIMNSTSVLLAVFVSLGTVSLIEFSRDQETWDNCGVIAGQFRINPGDSLRITYVIVPPTVVAYPF